MYHDTVLLINYSKLTFPVRYLLLILILALGIVLTLGSLSLNVQATSNSSDLEEEASDLGTEILKKAQSVSDEISELAGLPPNQFSVDDSDSSNSSSTQTSNSSNFEKANIVLLSQKLKKGQFSYNDIVGQVKNIGNDTAHYVEIGLTAYDKNGDVVGTDSTFASATSLKPNQKSTFEISFLKDDLKGMKSYELTLQWRDSDGTDQYVENAEIYED